MPRPRRARPPLRGEVHLVVLDPTRGSEIRKTRPCVVVSPDEANRQLSTVVICPLTSGGRDYPSRVSCRFQGKEGRVVLDQIRTADRVRIVKRLGVLPEETMTAVSVRLAEYFGP